MKYAIVLRYGNEIRYLNKTQTKWLTENTWLAPLLIKDKRIAAIVALHYNNHLGRLPEEKVAAEIYKPKK